MVRGDMNHGCCTLLTKAEAEEITILFFYTNKYISHTVINANGSWRHEPWLLCATNQGGDLNTFCFVCHEPRLSLGLQLILCTSFINVFYYQRRRRRLSYAYFCQQDMQSVIELSPNRFKI